MGRGRSTMVGVPIYEAPHVRQGRWRTCQAEISGLLYWRGRGRCGTLGGSLISCAFHMKHRRVAMAGVRDSKQIKDRGEMKRLYDALTGNEEWSWALGEISHTEIDDIYHGNNLAARLAAMTLAVRELQTKLRLEAARNGMSPYWKILIDGDKIPSQLASSVTFMQTIVRGDDKILEISAASIIAKWTRDEVMRNVWHKRFPQYGFLTNVGYGSSKVQQEALYKYGPCPCHRRSFSPIRKIEEARLKRLPNPYEEKEKERKQRKSRPKASGPRSTGSETKTMNALGRTARPISTKAALPLDWKAKVLQAKVAQTTKQQRKNTHER